MAAEYVKSEVYIATHEHKWFRDNEDGTYTFYKAEYHNDEWYCGGGTFSLSIYDKDDIEYALATHGIPKMAWDHMDDRNLASMLCDNHFADWDLEVFATEDDAIGYIEALIAREESK